MMAEEGDSSEERTEEATPRRQEEARRKGQVARSRDLTMTLALIAGTASLILFSSGLLRAFQAIATSNLKLAREEIFDTHALGIHLGQAIWTGMGAIVGPLTVMFVATIFGSILIGGFLFSWEALIPQWERMNPLSGMKRMFSLRALLELLKAVLKFVLVGICCILILRSRRGEIMGLADEAVPAVFFHVTRLVGYAFVWMSASLVLVALIDAPAQWFTFMKELRMTRQELKEEYKDTEGKPEVKARLRQMQRKMAEARMMAKIPKADVVITNPTHYAVALKYEADKDGAPILVAKGADHMAMQIRKIATEHQVTIVEAPPLARSIYHTTDLDREIPTGLYMAVAQILAWLHQLKRFKGGRGRHPGCIPEVDIPDDLRRDI